jgi:hypothetical protein
MKMKVGIIGGGIFGLSCAINLDKTHDVTVFDQASDIMTGATYANHNRHHLGYHYPRSPETAQQCLESREDFEHIYKSSCTNDYASYYCVSKEDTKTSAENYIRFCDEVGLNYKEEWPQEGVLDRSRIELSLRTEEGVYDFLTLKKLVKERIAKTSTIQIKLDHCVIDGSAEPGGEKILVVQNDEKRHTYNFDFVINAMYANHNRFCDWFGFKKRLFQFNLQELCVIDLPVDEPIGITIQDGPFPSFLPLGFSKNRCLFAHVEASQLIRNVSKENERLLSRVLYVESNWHNILKVSEKYIPILNKSNYVKSIFVDRIVDANRMDTDARLTELTSHGNGCWSVFAAKIITCESMAKKISAGIRGHTT